MMKIKKNSKKGSNNSSENSVLTIEDSSSICSSRTDVSIEEIITTSNENAAAKNKFKSPKENEYCNISEASVDGQYRIVKKKKRKHRDISCKNEEISLNSDIDVVSSDGALDSSILRNSSESEGQQKLRSKIKTEIINIESLDMFGGSPNVNHINDSYCSVDSAEMSFKLHQDTNPNNVNTKKRKKYKTLDLVLSDEDSSKMKNSDESGSQQKLQSKIKNETINIVSQDMFEDSSDVNDLNYMNCSADSAEMSFKLHQDTNPNDVNIKKRKKQQNESPEKIPKKHKASKKSKYSHETDGQQKIHSKKKSKQKDELDAICDEMIKKIKQEKESPKKKSKKHKIADYKTRDETSSVADFETSSKRKHQSKEMVPTKKKCGNGLLSPSIMNGLLKKLDGMKSPDARKNSSLEGSTEKSAIDEAQGVLVKKEKNLVTDFFSPSLIDGLTPDVNEIKIADEEESTSNESGGKKNRKKLDSLLNEATAKSSSSSKMNKMIELKKNSKIAFIPDVVLDNLLMKIDKIVEEDKVKHLNSKEIKKELIEKSSDDKSTELIKEEKIIDKKKVLKLLEETTSVARIKEELNIATDYDIEEKLAKICIEIPWPLPIIHKIASNVSAAPTLKQREKLEAAGIKVKLGKYTKEEDHKINKNWSLFCKFHKWDEGDYQPFLLGSSSSKHGMLAPGKFKKFVKFISHNFEDRLMYNIYLRFQRIFMKKEKEYKYFSPEDDKIILQYTEESNKNRPYADLAVLLKRSRLSILKRYKLLRTERSFDNGKLKWDKYLTKQLLKNVLKVTGAESFADLKERHIHTEEWEEISKVMGIPSYKLSRVWVMDLYTRVFNPNYEEQVVEVRDKLVKILLEKQYSDWREVDWQELATMFDSFTSQRLYKMFVDGVTRKLPKETQKDLKACLEHLKKHPPRKKINGFRYVNEILQEIEDERCAMRENIANK